MNTKRGYRIKASSFKEFSSFLDEFRSDTTKILARKWSRDVSKRAVEAADFASLSLAKPSKDFIRMACDELNQALVSMDMTKHVYNCTIDFYFVDNGVLAAFTHGDQEYHEALRRKRIVEHWGWARDVNRPESIPVKNWALREKIWTALEKRPPFGQTMRLTLLNGPLPAIGWKSISAQLIPFETRIDSCVSAVLAQEGKSVRSVSEIERKKIRDRVLNRIPEEISLDYLMGKSPAAKVTNVIKSPIATVLPVRKVEEASKPKAAAKGVKAAVIDHADIILSSDGRTFIAVPNVGFADETRVFVHVGSKDVVFIQDGVNFGTVTDVPDAAREHLKFCKDAILVEVEKNDDGRLLRAKYVAIVSDISFTENSLKSIIGFKRPARTSAASRELEQWEKESKKQ